jgi:hypothetical protein
MGVALVIIYFNRVLHYKPSIWGYSHLWNPPNTLMIWLEIRCDQSVISTTSANNLLKYCKPAIKEIQKGFLPDCILDFATKPNQSRVLQQGVLVLRGNGAAERMQVWRLRFPS